MASRSLFIVFYAALILRLVSTAGAAPQNQGDPRSAANVATQQPQVIRSATRLVQVSVVVQAKNGAPITGLKQANFTLLDNGKPQQVAFFSANAPAPLAARPHPLPGNVFTNRAELKGQEPGATIAILFDALNTSFEDQSRARQQILRFLQSFKPQDHVAIFTLTDNLALLHGFTEDSAALTNSVNRFSPRLMAAFDASHPANLSVAALSNDPFWKSFENHVNNANGEIADSRVADRFRTTYAALVAIADYVANIPGHKSLVWVSGGIPIDVGIDHIGTPDRDNFSLDNSAIPGVAGDMTALARALNRANMSVYPVDAAGIDVDDSQSAFFARHQQRDSFRLLADKTGGKAFYGTNDIAGAIESAFDDGRYTYTLGFYPDHNEWNGEFRDIKIQLPVAGAHLHYRRGYFALREKSDAEALSNTDLQQAAFSPLDATTLGITLRGKPQPSTSARVLQLQVGLDPKEFLLHDQENRMAGGLDLLFLQKDAGGNFLAAEKQHFEVNFSRKEYAMLAKSGLVLQRRLTIAPGAAEIRVLVRDATSGALGSVTVPLNKLL
ncbi:MAG TPA: VWA domain-containing protein [Candidatus Acidoferrum sp.]|jgi:VWFA-related protein